MPSSKHSSIDYSKWDKIDYGSSSDEEEEEEDISQPQVTKLDKPSKITRTADGSLIIHEQQQNHDAATEASPSAIGRPVASSSLVDTETKNNPSSLDNYAVPDSWTEKGSAEIVQDCYLYWCQDRYSVTLRLAVPDHGKWTCNVSNLLAYEDRLIAVGNTPKSVLEIKRKDKETIVLFKKELAYPVHAAEDEEGGGGVDWSIENRGPGKYMTITLYKAVPMEGITIWWKRPLAEMEEISLDWRDQTSGAFQDAWKEAHEKFREKRRESNCASTDK
jgi:hypothetical protein